MNYKVLANGDILVTPRPSGSTIQSLRRRLWMRDPYCCWCGFLFVDPHHATLEHLQFRSLGGGNSMENCRIACESCNNGRDKWYTRALLARGMKRPKGAPRRPPKTLPVWPDGQAHAKVITVRGARVRAVVY